MANTFNSTQMSDMSSDIALAQADLKAGSLASAISAISLYYEVQLGFNGYSELAYQVENNQNVYGQTANQVLSFDNITYGSLASVQLIVQLASNNYTDIETNGSLSATESQIEQEHADAYQTEKIPIQFWGAAAFSNANENWIGSTATTQELSNTINSNFNGLSASVVKKNLFYVVAAGMIVDVNIYAQYGNPLLFNSQDPTGATEIQDFIQNLDGIDDLLHTVPVSGALINLLNGLESLGPIDDPTVPNQFSSILGLYGTDAGNAVGVGVAVAMLPTISGTSSHDLNLAKPESAPGSSVTDTIENGYIEFSISGESSYLVFELTGNTSFTATLSDQIVIASGGSDALYAGTNNVLLIASDIGGTNTFIAGSNSSVSEILVAGSTIANSYASGSLLSHNVFSFSNGTNVLIGDLGHNTFVENPTITSGTNIIWGGGGTSTYDLHGDVVLLYTSTSPTVAQIESLVSTIQHYQPQETTLGWGPFEWAMDPSGIPGFSVTQGVAADEPITYLIDPNKDDILEGANGAYTPQQYLFMNVTIGSFELPSGTLSESTANIASSPINGDFELEINNSVTSSVDLSLYNFVNGDLGITFSGNTFKLAYGGPPDTQAGYLVDSAIAGNVYSYKKKTMITLPKSASVQSKITMSPVPAMAILKPIVSAIPEPWAPNMAPDFFHLTADQMGILESKKILPSLGFLTIDPIESAKKWIPMTTIQA